MANRFTYEEIEAYLKYSPEGRDGTVPDYITDNLPASIALRDYQKDAIRHFIAYYEDETGNLRQGDKVWALLQMATASGKTLIMASLILYLYRQGYRNFLFFVNRGALVEKTRRNFCDSSFGKYLFAQRIVIDGKVVKTKACLSLSDTDPDAINIVFTTTAGLHVSLTTPKEDGISFSSFKSDKVVLLADESHHNKGQTKSKKTSDNNGAWEETVERVYEANDGNVMLEFSATSGIDHDNEVRKSYEIGSDSGKAFVYNYDLSRFRLSGYTKELVNLRSTMGRTQRLIQAMMLSQYRLRLFEDMGIGGAKPVILCRLQTKRACDDAYNEVMNLVRGDLTGAFVAEIRRQAEQSPYVSQMFAYFDRHGVTDEMIAEELRRAFPPRRVVKIYSSTSRANEDKDMNLQQLIADLNNLESPEVPYRMILTVEMLTEGWDALNLFDVVLLDENPPKKRESTIKEAQLIGRGARYYPFECGMGHSDQRKYDDDTGNENRLCETFLYHCVDDSAYIMNLRKALKSNGLDFDEPEKEVSFEYRLKDTFRNSDFYQSAYILRNERVKQERTSIRNGLDGIGSGLFVRLDLDASTHQNTMLGNDDLVSDTITGKRKAYQRSVHEFPQNIISKAMRTSGIRFSDLKRLVPSLTSTSEFVGKEASSRFIGDLRVEIVSSATPTPTQWCDALTSLFVELRKRLSKMGEQQVYRGTREFKRVRLKDCITDVNRKRKQVVGEDGEGVSQNAPSVAERMRLDLSDKEWFAYTDNYGTTEEKMFVAWFASKMSLLEEHYDTVYLIRNESQLRIYKMEPFVDQGTFEPDYILVLIKGDEQTQQQIFIEPKGTNLLEPDKWKEELLVSLEEQAIIDYSDENYRVIGLPFFNWDNTMERFENAFKEKVLV